MLKRRDAAFYLAAAITISACGAEQPGDGVADADLNQAVGETSEAISSDTWIPLRYAFEDKRLYVGPYWHLYDNNDWAFGKAKGECGGKPGGIQTTTIVGISYVPPGDSSCWFDCYQIGGYNNAMLCSTSQIKVNQRDDELVTAPMGKDNQLDKTWGDWAVGMSKLECRANQVVTGIAGRNVLCSVGDNLKTATGCNLRWFPSKDDRPAVNRGDWDRGNPKGECRFGEYVKGVALDPFDLYAKGILCCSPSLK